MVQRLCLSAPRADRNFAKSTCASIHSRYFVSAHRVQIATFLAGISTMRSPFVSAHRVQIATATVHKAPRADLWNAL